MNIKILSMTAVLHMDAIEESMLWDLIDDDSEFVV